MRYIILWVKEFIYLLRDSSTLDFSSLYTDDKYLITFRSVNEARHEVQALNRFFRTITTDGHSQHAARSFRSQRRKTLYDKDGTG